MRVDHLAGTARGDASGRQQRHVLIGFDSGNVGFFAGGDHAVCEIVMANTVEHHHVQRADALDVLGPRLVGVRVEARRNQGNHLGLVADNIAHVAVVGVQGDADSQRLAVIGQGHCRQGKGQEQGEGGAKHGRVLGFSDGVRG
ncbi:hypothetical protein D9M73_157570 [compost metagenome]